MGGPARFACNGSRHSRIHVFVVLFALLLALAITPFAAADTGSGTAVTAPPGGEPAAAEQPPPADTSSGPSNETAIQSSHSSQDDAGAPGEDGTSPGPMAPAEPSGTPNGEAGTPPGQAGSPSGQAAAPAGPPGEGGNPPAEAAQPQGQTDQGVAIDQQVGASASAVQDDVGNTLEQVQIGQPGDTPGVGQENHAGAGASASGVADAATGGEPVVQQDTTATASAEQAGVSNTHVTVRVESPGENGSVTQVNEAAGTAAAGSTGAAADPGSAAATAAASQEDVSNTHVSVRVFSPGDDGAVTQQNQASAHAAAGQAPGNAAASAHQNGAWNTHVSIRVGSPGTEGAVSQENSTLATTGDPAGAASDAGAASAAVAVSQDALDTSVAVNVPGTGLEQPGTGPSDLEVWEWNWVWRRDESTGAEGAVPGDMSTWNWAWGAEDGSGPDQGVVTRRTATEADQAGSWTWNWDWSRQGVDWNWSWDWARAVDCGGCVWVWNWSWEWTGAPTASPAGATSSTATPSAPAPRVSQVNTASAVATASAAATVAQAVVQDGIGAADQYAGQLVAVVQDAEAIALAHQADVASFWTNVGPVDQENAVVADAAADVGALIDQSIVQQVASAGGSAPDQWIGQQVDVLQQGSAEASGLQRGVALAGAGTHAAVGEADAAGRVAVDQTAAQGALADGGSLAQWVGQLTVVEQGVDATVAVAQTGTWRSRIGGATAVATATADGLADVSQTATQHAARDGGLGSQTIGQVVYVGQDADAHATTTQQAGGAALGLASSEAAAGNRVIAVQAGAQDLLAAADFDIQELWQESLVVQTATATSTSLGGIAGTATALNCAVTQQSAGQGILVGGNAPATRDLWTYCDPPAAPAPASTPVQGVAPGAIAEPVATAVPAPLEDDVQLFRGGRPYAAASGTHADARTASGAPQLRAPFAPPTWQTPAGSPVSQVSALHSAQARIDTRPGSSAGTGNAGKEPPLPPAGDPPAWISALAAAAAAAGGSSGIAAILLSLLLVPPLVQRARDRSVVRRPTLLTSWVDVPV